MSYLIERSRALRDREVVAVLAFRRGKTRSRIILRDNSLVHTLTRPKTLARQANDATRQGATWWTQR